MRPTARLHRSLFFAATLLFALVQSGCMGSANVVEPSQAAPAETLISPTELPTITPTLRPVKTLVPRFTPTPRLITPAAAEGTVVDRSMVSPDGEWTALPGYEDLPSGYHISLSVFDKDRKTVWTPVDFTGDGLGHMSPNPRRWSNDSRYFYYAESTVYDGCGDFSPREDTWQQLDVQTGKVTPFELPPGRGHQISPDESLMAYTSLEAPLELIIVDMAAQTEQRAALLPGETEKYVQGGRIRWSPDGEDLILSVQAGDICVGQTPKFYLLLIDLEDLKVSTLYQGGDYILATAWDPSGKILVTDWSRRSWWMDSVSGEVTTAP